MPTQIREIASPSRPRLISKHAVERERIAFAQRTGVRIDVAGVDAAIRDGRIRGDGKGLVWTDSLEAFLGAQLAHAKHPAPASRTANRAPIADPLLEAARKTAVAAERARVTQIIALDGPDAIKDKAIADGISPAAAGARIHTAASDAAKTSVDQYLALTGRASR
jgi:hypothetical protein